MEGEKEILDPLLLLCRLSSMPLLMTQGSEMVHRYYGHPAQRSSEDEWLIIPTKLYEKRRRKEPQEERGAA